MPVSMGDAGCEAVAVAAVNATPSARVRWSATFMLVTVTFSLPRHCHVSGEH